MTLVTKDDLTLPSIRTAVKVIRESGRDDIHLWVDAADVLLTEIDRLTAEREEIRSKMSDDAHASDMCAVAWMNRAEAAEEQRDALLRVALAGSRIAAIKYVWGQEIDGQSLDDLLARLKELDAAWPDWRAQTEGKGKG